MQKSKAIIVDLDGTLTNCDHRVHYLKKEKKDWGSFYAGLSDDSLNIWCFELIEAFRSRGYKILFVTGRMDTYREATLGWLKKFEIQFDELLMRRAGDHSEDYEVKEKIYNDKIKDRYNILFVVDDRASVVAKWRQLGLVCLQCDEGNF